jgi:hypothetical protein
VRSCSLMPEVVVDPGTSIPVPLSASKSAEASTSGKSDAKAKARETKPQEVRASWNMPDRRLAAEIAIPADRQRRISRESENAMLLRKKLLRKYG